MNRYEIICCLRELVKNAASADGTNPKITIINDVRLDSFTFVIEEAIHEIEKSIIVKPTDFDDIWDL